MGVPVRLGVCRAWPIRHASGERWPSRALVTVSETADRVPWGRRRLALARARTSELPATGDSCSGFALGSRCRTHATGWLVLRLEEGVRSRDTGALPDRYRHLAFDLLTERDEARGLASGEHRHA